MSSPQKKVFVQNKSGMYDRQILNPEADDTLRNSINSNQFVGLKQESSDILIDELEHRNIGFGEYHQEQSLNSNFAKEHLQMMNHSALDGNSQSNWETGT